MSILTSDAKNFGLPDELIDAVKKILAPKKDEKPDEPPLEESFVDDLERNLPKSTDKMVCDTCSCGKVFRIEEMKHMSECPHCGGVEFTRMNEEKHYINSRDKKRVKVKIRGKWVWKMQPSHRIAIGN